MSTKVKQLLQEFDGLTEPEKKDIALEILRRSAQWDYSPLTDEALVENADQLFLELDRAESAVE